MLRPETGRALADSAFADNAFTDGTGMEKQAILMVCVLSAGWLARLPVCARAATGDLIVEYRASVGTTPERQEWDHEGKSLQDHCPGPVDLGSQDEAGDCYWQGARDLNSDTFPDNNCLLGTGCRKDREHYNAPVEVLGIDGSSTYTEWIVFDDGKLPGDRPLTIADAPLTHTLNTVRVVDTPPFGAHLFPGAPVGYFPLRLSVGSGSDRGRVLPVAEAEDHGKNHRNGGRIDIRSDPLVPLLGGVGNATVIARMAFGPWSLDDSDICLELRVPSTAAGHHWRFGITPPNSIPGHPGERAVGVSNRKSSKNRPLAYPFGDASVRRYDPSTETWSGGRFYTFQLHRNWALPCRFA